MQQKKLCLTIAPSKILLITMRYLGDTLLTTPLIHSIKQQYPNSQIDVLVHSHTAAMLAGNPDVNRVITIPVRPKLTDYWQLLRTITRRYNIAVVTETGDRRLIYAFIAGSKRVGFLPPKGERRGLALRVLDAWSEFDNISTHTVLEFLKLASLIGAKPRPKLIAPKPASNVDLVSLQIAKPYVVLHPHPQWRYKRWPINSWVKLCLFLSDKGYQLTFSGSPDAEEQKYIEQIRNQLSIKTVNLAGRLSIAELSELIKNSELFVGPDTGITHLAAATGTKTVALFGPTNKVKWSPWPVGHGMTNPFDMKGSQQNANVLLIQGEGDCVPCFDEGCEKHRASYSACLDSLMVDTVVKQITQFINA
jgi:heptosyltransferase-3